MPRSVILCLLVATSCGAKSASEEPQPRPQVDACAWGVDDLLRESDAPVEARESCGYFAASAELVAPGFQCLEAAIDAGRPAELTVNFCIDCSIPSTFVSTSTGELLRVEMEDDFYGDELRTARVERCENIETDSRQLPQCVNPSQLYLCQDPRR